MNLNIKYFKTFSYKKFKSSFIITISVLVSYIRFTVTLGIRSQKLLQRSTQRKF